MELNSGKVLTINVFEGKSTLKWQEREQVKPSNSMLEGIPCETVYLYNMT